MKLTLVTVGKPSDLVAGAIREYETRARRYWKLDATEVRPEKAARGRSVTAVRRAEGERIMAAVPHGLDLVALTRTGESWSSDRLATYLAELALRGAPGAAFVVGGAFGLDRAIIRTARHRLSLSPMTMPHDLARLIFAEQLYRAGTINRGEPYHKG